MKRQFDSLPPAEKDAYRKAGEYMYEKDYSKIDSSVDNAVQYIRKAFDAGMMPSQLTDDELVFLRGLYGPEWFKQFGFPSEQHSGIEKKTSSKQRVGLAKRPAPIQMPRLDSKKQTLLDFGENIEEEESHPEVVTEEENPEELEHNREISYVYTVWS